MDVIALLPRFIEPPLSVAAILAKSGWFRLRIALASSEADRSGFRGWASQEALDWWIVDGESVDLAVEVVGMFLDRPRPAAVLLFDGPCCEGYASHPRRDWAERFARALAANHTDVQVFEYDPSWATTPPRIR